MNSYLYVQYLFYLGGVAYVYSAHYLDTVKVKMQAFPTLYKSVKFVYMLNIYHCSYTILPLIPICLQ